MDKKQMYSAMETDIGKSLDAFNAAVADIMSATYIIVSGKISRLLQTVAQSRPLYEFLAEETKAYNFVKEFRSRQFRDENGHPYIAVPEDAHELMRFAFCLLFAVDTGKINIENLLHTFYRRSDANAELHAFCTEVIEPFANRVNAVFTQSTDVSDSPEELQTQKEGAAESVAPSVPAADTRNDGILDELYALTAEIVDIAAKNITLTTADREELLLVCDAFRTALGIKERNSIRLMYIALKNTARCSEIFPELEERFNDVAYLVNNLA